MGSVMQKCSFRKISPRTVMMLRRAGLQAPRRFRCLCAGPAVCGTANCPCFQRGAKCNAHCHATAFACQLCPEPRLHPTLGFAAQQPLPGQAAIADTVVDVVSDDEVWTGPGGGGHSEEAQEVASTTGKRKTKQGVQASSAAAEPTSKKRKAGAGGEVQETTGVHIKVEKPARVILQMSAETHSPCHSAMIIGLC